MNKKELRDKFFKEQTYKCENGIPRVVTHPHNLFEWMHEQLVKNCSIPGVSNSSVSITPKGIIFLALGGYTAEEEGINTKENISKIEDFLCDFMKRNNCAMVLQEDRLGFVNLIPTKDR